jgi:hypothetical protein
VGADVVVDPKRPPGFEAAAPNSPPEAGAGFALALLEPLQEKSEFGAEGCSFFGAFTLWRNKKWKEGHLQQ